MAAVSLVDDARAGRDADHVLGTHAGILSRFEDVAESCLADGNFEHAIAAAGMAGWLAGFNHPGVLASPRLEAVLTEISRETLSGLPARRTPKTPERVLVVVTTTYAVGGHTRMLWRWIARDPSRVYTVVTTGQHGSMPQGVREAVRRSGGEIVDLDPRAPAVHRAAALRRLAADADLIVLLDHPHDPLPTVAFAELGGRPPIVMFDHGDHLFWLGRGIVDALMSIRSIGPFLAARRGLPGDRVLRTPFPVSGPDGHGGGAGHVPDAEGRARARASVLAQLGWPPETVVLVTAGNAHKYNGAIGHRLLDVIEPVVAADPRVCLVAAGPADTGQWRELRERTGGRVAAVGPVPEGLGVLHAAGDIYLESRPLGGPGAASEAAAHRLPVISGGATPLERDLLMTDPAYGAVCAPSDDACRALLVRLIAEPALRAEYGRSAREAVVAADARWETAVEEAYALARKLGPIEQGELGPLPEPGDVDVLVDYSSPESRRVPIERLAFYASLFELTGRSAAVRRLFGALDPGSMQQIGRYDFAFAAPPPKGAGLRAIVTEFRVLRDLGIAERFALALEPDALDEAVPVLEAALSEGTDVDINVMVDPDPSRLRPAGSLEVVLEDDGRGDQCRHVCRSAAAVR